MSSDEVLDGFVPGIASATSKILRKLRIIHRSSTRLFIPALHWKHSEAAEFVEKSEPVPGAQAHFTNSYYLCESDTDNEESEDESLEQLEVITNTTCDLTTLEPYLFIRGLPSQVDFRVVLPNKVDSTPAVTLVLDLDETLVHCSTQPMVLADFKFDLTIDGLVNAVWARKRPFLEEFLSYVRGKFEVILFTASQEIYASRVMDFLDPLAVVRKRLYREACVQVDGNFVKHLGVLNRDLSKVVIIDNAITSFGFNVDNGIPIESWFGDDPTQDDTELIKLIPLLDKLATADDIRPILRETFKLADKIEQLTKPFKALGWFS